MSYPNPKFIKGLIATTLALAAVQAAQAENKLFPTDVLNQGQLDASATLSGSKSTDDFVYNPSSQPGTSKNYTSQLSAGMRYGVNASLTVGGTVSGVDERATTIYNNVPVRYDDTASGIHSESIFAKYAFIGGKNAPMTLSGEITATTYSSHNIGGDGYNAATVQLFAGWDCGQGVRSYATLHFTAPDRGNHTKSEGVTVGSWISVSDNATIIPSLSLSHSQETTTTPATSSYTLGLAGLVAVDTNTYLRPAASIGKQTSHDSLNGNFHYDGSKTESASLELYHLF
ncbi:MAG: hypothetical protein EPO09_19020 [Aquabacterium sp.]|uniref:hypothetical protein n=1 Tax=Aquabacterium sp. TaxID=1872578 RepID=UPI001221DEAA|nr:hypothetical protein [Aquabacterium sp.]TAK87085.1 MAG: hypothetical protein EPO09_19020 [Aquabacterium sp.]